MSRIENGTATGKTGLAKYVFQRCVLSDKLRSGDLSVKFGVNKLNQDKWRED